MQVLLQRCARHQRPSQKPVATPHCGTLASVSSEARSSAQAVKIRQVTQLDREGALEAGDAGAVRVKRQHLISLLDPQTFQTAFVAHQPPTGGNVLEANAS